MFIDGNVSSTKIVEQSFRREALPEVKRNV